MSPPLLLVLGCTLYGNRAMVPFTTDHVPVTIAFGLTAEPTDTMTVALQVNVLDAVDLA
jgi:hypothetical protein